jgi:hypothetical protein
MAPKIASIIGETPSHTVPNQAADCASIVPSTVTAVDAASESPEVLSSAASSVVTAALVSLEDEDDDSLEDDDDVVDESCAVGVPEVLLHAPVSRATATTAGSTL